MKASAIGEGREVVSPFENADQAVFAMPAGDIDEQVGHPSKRCGLQFERSQRIEPVGVESRGNQHELRSEAFHLRKDRIVKRRSPDSVFAGWKNRDVDGEPFARTATAFVRKAGAGIEYARVTVQADVKDARVVVETVLCSVAVVHVPIEDKHSFEIVIHQ